MRTKPIKELGLNGNLSTSLKSSKERCLEPSLWKFSSSVFCVTDWVEQCPYFLRLPFFIAPWFDRPGNRGFSAGRELWLVGIIKPNYLDGRCSIAS